MWLIVISTWFKCVGYLKKVYSNFCWHFNIKQSFLLNSYHSFVLVRIFYVNASFLISFFLKVLLRSPRKYYSSPQTKDVILLTRISIITSLNNLGDYSQCSKNSYANQGDGGSWHLGLDDLFIYCILYTIKYLY